MRAEEGLGFDKAVETCKARMARYQVTPNMLVVPPALLLYLALGPDEKIKCAPRFARHASTPIHAFRALTPPLPPRSYSFAGPTGPSNFEAGVNGYETRAFRGCGVFASTPFEVSDESDSMQMLQRSTQVGEFYRMKPPEVWNVNADDGKLPAHYMVRLPPTLQANASLRALPYSHMHCHFLAAGHPHLRRGVRPPRAHHL